MAAVAPLDGRTALVTGASRGIGAAIADRLQEAGARSVRLARTVREHVDAASAEYRCDVSDEASVERAVAWVLKTVGVPDIVVNNAGSFLIKSIVDTTPSEFEYQLRVNLLGPFLLVRLLLPHLIRRGATHIVNIGSVADTTAFPGNAAYAASKFGLRGFHGVLCNELAGTEVRATLISPGATNTPLWDLIDPDAAPDVMKREDMLDPDEVAESVLFAVTRPPRSHVESIRLSPLP